MQKKPRKPRIAIDGPAGAGKSTVARVVAARLGIAYLDTGAMYRAITLKFLREGVSLNDQQAIEAALEQTELDLKDDLSVLMDGEDVSAEIRTPWVNEMVSPVSAIPLVRRKLVLKQRQIASSRDGIVMEGRDIATVVMPDADFKFYLKASLEERARRRLKEQLEKGLELEAAEVEAEIGSRDRIDSGRKDSPLSIADDAIVVDTTSLSFEQVVEALLAVVQKDAPPGETG